MEEAGRVHQIRAPEVQQPGVLRQVPARMHAATTDDNGVRLQRA
jgi:hypothetical protein